MTAKVKVHRYLFSESAGLWQTFDATGNTLADCLKQAIARFPRMKNEIFDASVKLQGHILVLLNGEEVQPDELDHKVNDGDTIEVLPIIGGG